MMEYVQLGSTLARRAVGERGPENYDLPSWALGIVIVIAVVFAPLFIFVSPPGVASLMDTDIQDRWLTSAELGRLYPEGHLSHPRRHRRPQPPGVRGGAGQRGRRR